MDCGLVSQNAPCCRHKNMERTPDTSLSGGKSLSANTIHIIKHRPMQCKQLQFVSVPLPWPCVDLLGRSISRLGSSKQEPSPPSGKHSRLSSAPRRPCLKPSPFFLLLFELGCCGAAISDSPPALLMASSMHLGHHSDFKLLYSSYQMQTRHFRHFKCFVTWTYVVYHLNCDQQSLRRTTVAHKQLN